MTENTETFKEEETKTNPETNEVEQIQVNIKMGNWFVDALNVIDKIKCVFAFIFKWIGRIFGLALRLLIGYPLILLFVITSSIFIASWVWLKNCYCKFVGKPYNMGEVKDIKTHITKDVTTEPTEEKTEEANE